MDRLALVESTRIVLARVESTDVLRIPFVLNFLVLVKCKEVLVVECLSSARKYE